MKCTLNRLNKDILRPALGCGVGLRHDHYQHILQTWPSSIDWFEAITENYMDSGGKPIQILEKVRHRYPVALHGVSLSIGSADLVNENYLTRLKALIARVEPAIVSDHLCWTRVDGDELHDLLPLPFTEEAIRHVVSRVQQVQEFLGRKILLENVSSYVTYRHSEMPEWEFLKEVSARSGCGVLLDLNNVYVNSVNHRFDPYEYVKNIPGSRVGQFHLSGHTDMGSFLFDTHDHEVIDEVWNLYRFALNLWGPVATLIEWDANIPDFKKLAEEVGKARGIYQNHPHLQQDERLHTLPQQKSVIKTTAFDQPALGDVQRWFKVKMKPYAQTIGLSQRQLDAALLNLQNGTPGLERIAVYADGYKARIEEALSESHEAIAHVLGHSKFHFLAEEYAEQYPSRHYNLSSTGKYFSEFIGRHSISKELPFLSDLAQLEWLIHQAFHAYDKPAFEASQFAGMSPEDWGLAKLIFQPSVGLIVSKWPILDVWKARKTPVEKINIDFVNRPQKILIARSFAQVTCNLLDDRQFFLVNQLLQGKKLGDACEELTDFCGDNEDAPIQTWFTQWIQAGLITDVALTE